MDERFPMPASHLRASRSADATCPYSGVERRELPAQAIEGTAAVCDPTRRRGRPGYETPAISAGRPWYVVLNVHAAKWSVFAPPQRPAFTPPLTGPSCRLPVVSPLECIPRIPGEVPTTSPPAANERNNARLAGCPAGVRPDKRLCHMGDERIELRLRGLGIFHP